VTGDRFIELRHDVLVNILGATDDGRDHPKINHPEREHIATAGNRCHNAHANCT
jgi:hypothetical protein